jgi:DNA modification methylase
MIAMTKASATDVAERVRTSFQEARRKGHSPYYDLPTFCDHGPDHRTTKLHRYTACYLPELAARLIRRHSRPGETVVDSFLGGGTTAIQAVANGRRALGVDVHPAAVEIARARLAPVFPGALDNAVGAVKRTLGRRKLTRVRFPPELDGWDWQRWFPAHSHAVLSQLRRVITDTPRADVRRLLLVATAGALKQVSYWYSHATKLQFDPTKKPLGVGEVMLPRLEEIKAINQELWEHVGGRAGSQQRRDLAVLTVGDCCALPFGSECADLAVSSPPYFIAYDYAKLLRLTSWWMLGHVPGGAGHLETSGRGTDMADEAPLHLGDVFRRLFRAAFRRLDAEGPGCSPSHVRTLIRSLVPFFDGIRRSLCEVFRVLRPYGKVCLVLGNTRQCGLTVPTAEITVELALLQGFRIVAVHVRRQHSATQPQARNGAGEFTSDASPEQYSYRDEYVVVLRKP